MSSAAHIGPRPRRRLRIGKLVILGILLAALVEPIIMYRTLVRQRELRQDARHQVEVLSAQGSVQ